MNLYQDKLYIRIVALNVIYNFLLLKSFFCHRLKSQNIILSLWILKFKI